MQRHWTKLEIHTHTQAYLYALTDHYAEPETNSTPLDSGSARHIHNAVVVTDPGAARSLIDINGNISWTQGTGYIPITLKDGDGQILNLDLQDADYRDDTAFPMLSLCKLPKEDWKFHLTQDEPYDATPGGDKIIFFVGNDNVLRLAHGIREGDDTKHRASAAASAAHLKYGPAGMMDPSPASGQPMSYGASMA